MENEFSQYLTGFTKNDNTWNSLLKMIESWKSRLNNGLKVGVMIIDLPKVFRNNTSVVRSSRPEVFCKKGVLRNFAKFTGKHLRQSLFFNKVAGLRPAT